MFNESAYLSDSGADLLHRRYYVRISIIIIIHGRSYKFCYNRRGEKLSRLASRDNLSLGGLTDRHLLLLFLFF